MDPQVALQRLGDYCLLGTGIKGGGYPVPGMRPNLPACAVFLTGIDGGEAGRITYRGGAQELLVRAEVRLYVADINEAEKVAGSGDALVFKVVDRFRLERGNPAITLGTWDDTGMVKHCHLLTPVQASQSIPGWGAYFYGAVFPFEIKIVRLSEQIT